MSHGPAPLAAPSLSTTVLGIETVHRGEETSGRTFHIVMESTETTEGEPAPHNQQALPGIMAQNPSDYT